MRTHTKNSGEIGDAPRMPKRVMFLSPIQLGLSATYPAPILTAVEIINVNQCPHAYTQKFRNSAHEILQVPKQLKWVFSRGVCNKATAQTAQFRAMGIVSGTIADILRMCLL